MLRGESAVSRMWSYPEKSRDMTWRPEQIQLPEDPSERIGPMSQSAWCNINDKETNAPFQVGHAFNADDEDREHFTKTRKVNVETGNSYGRPTYQERQEITETLDMCGYHSRKQAGLFQKTPEITAEVID